jgi:hypothetical protein
MTTMLRYSSLIPLGRDPAPPRAEPPLRSQRDVAGFSDEGKALLARHTVVLAAAARGQIAETNPSVVAARQFFGTAFSTPAPQEAQTITATDAEAILRKWGRW